MYVSNKFIVAALPMIIHSNFVSSEKMTSKTHDDAGKQDPCCHILSTDTMMCLFQLLQVCGRRNLRTAGAGAS